MQKYKNILVYANFCVPLQSLLPFMRKGLYIFLLSLALVSCANRGIGPQGGPRDSIPPIPLKSTPENGSVNFTGRRIEVAFNEYLQLDNIGQNLMMSPPQQHPPEVKARGKHLIIQFADTLRDSTTYTLDFGDAVCDYNEKNPLHNFSFGFSTGPTIDTLSLSGYVFNAEDNKPLYGMYVGIHDDLSDTAFTKHPFLRIARTDSAGYYRINNMRAGTYRLYAVDDVSRDYRLTPGEALAFADNMLTVPGDSTGKDTAAALYLFKPQQQRLYLKRTLRDQQHLVRLLFSSAPDSMPLIRPLRDSVAYHVHNSANGDTTMIWLTDSATISMDSLYFEARYRRTDSLFRLEWYTDTIRAIWRAPRMTEKALEAQRRRDRNRRLEIRTNARRDFEMYDTLRVACSTPLMSINPDAFHLYECIDTVRKPVPFSIAPYDTLPMRLTIQADLKQGNQYELRLDSAAMHDVYGVTHIAGTYQLKVKTPSDYSTLRVKILPFDPQARIQVLDSKGKAIREQQAETEGTLFRFLAPDSYKLRMYIDKNDDRQWTTGCWEEHRQPEPVFNHPNTIQTKSNWDFEEEWNYAQ